MTDGGRQSTLGSQDMDFYGISLSEGDWLKVYYDTPRSDYEQTRVGDVSEFLIVQEEYGPTGTEEVVLRRESGDIYLRPAWDEIRNESTKLGEILDVEKLDPDGNPHLLADGGTSPRTCDFCGLDEPTVATDGGRSSEMLDVQERQADALELIAGILLMDFDYDEDRPSYTVEALREEALFHAGVQR